MKHRILTTAGLHFIIMALLSACASGSSGESYKVEENTGSDREDYPYVVHTDSASWFLAEDDIKLLGEDAFYAGLDQILENAEPDFADAREALAGYIGEEVPPVNIYTDFCGKAEISKTSDAYYNDVSNFIKLFSGWESAESTLLHEYVHYLTQHCMAEPAEEGFFAEGAAEYISKIVCKNRMLRSVNMGFSEEEAAFYKEKGAWDEEEDCIDPKLFYFGTAQVIAGGGLVGTEYFAACNRMLTRTEEVPDADSVSFPEAACMFAYLVETYGKDTVFSNLNEDPDNMEHIARETFSDIYADWVKWNAEKCSEFGLLP